MVLRTFLKTIIHIGLPNPIDPVRRGYYVLVTHGDRRCPENNRGPNSLYYKEDLVGEGYKVIPRNSPPECCPPVADRFCIISSMSPRRALHCPQSSDNPNFSYISIARTASDFASSSLCCRNQIQVCNSIARPMMYVSPTTCNLVLSM